MDILKRIGLGIAVLVFTSCISLFAIFIGLYATLEHPETLKNALKTSGVYTAPTQENPLAKTSNPVALAQGVDPGIQQAFADAFSPEFIQNSSEHAIDSIYNWIEGKTASPDFGIDITAVKSKFADNVAVYIQQRLDSLPPCTEPVAQALPSADVSQLDCRPQDVPVATIAEQARQEVLMNPLFSDTNTISTSSFKDANGRPLSEQLSFVSTLHSYFLASLFVMPFLIVLCGLAIIFWSPSKQKGTKRAAWILIGVGLTNTIASLIGLWLLQTSANIFGEGASLVTIQGKFLTVMKILAIDLNNWWVGFGIGYVIAGIVLLMILRLQKNSYQGVTTAA